MAADTSGNYSLDVRGLGHGAPYQFVVTGAGDRNVQLATLVTAKLRQARFRRAGGTGTDQGAGKNHD